MSGIKIDQLEAIIVNSIEEVIEDNEEVLQGNVKAAGQQGSSPAERAKPEEEATRRKLRKGMVFRREDRSDRHDLRCP